MTDGRPGQEPLLLRSRYLLVELANADLLRLDVMAYVGNHFVRHGASFSVIFREARGLRLAHARTVGTRLSFSPPH